MEYNSEKILDNILEVLDNSNVLSINEDTQNFLIDFVNLPREEQLILFNELLDKLKFYKKIHQDKDNQKKCTDEGHLYSSWYERICFKSYKGSTFKNKIWCRKCSRCGHFDYTFVKPIELVKLEEEHNLENEIKVLQKKLTNLRNGE